MKLNKATAPLRLPRYAPPCFGGRESEWRRYRAGANYTAGDGFTFCTDCTKGYKENMQRLGRCRYPATTFVRTGAITVGRRRGRVVH